MAIADMHLAALKHFLLKLSFFVNPPFFIGLLDKDTASTKANSLASLHARLHFFFFPLKASR